MDFKDWLNENTLNGLYDSAVAAFPNTTKRQHATQPVRIVQIGWTPYLGLKTLFVKGLAQNEGREYNSLILFKKVSYKDSNGPGIVELNTETGKVFLERLSFDANDVVVRCNCPDFYWRFNYYNHLDKSLYGRKRAKYEAQHNPGSANPQEMPGMCKHLMKLSKALTESGIILP
mgnify:FL=1